MGWIASSGFALLAMTSCTIAHAEHVPIVRMDASDCDLRPWHNLGGCFENKTGEEIKDSELNYRQSIYYSDKRTKIVAIIPMQQTLADKNIVISTSTEVLKNNHIKKVDNELIIGRNLDGGRIPGCYFELTEYSSTTILKLLKTNNSYHCTP